MNRAEISGTVFRARCLPPILESQLYVFVPDFYFNFNEQENCDPSQINFGTFDEETFRISRWPRLNAVANRLTSDDHLMPDLENLLPDEAAQTCQFKNFEAALDRAVREYQGPSPA